jgi:hypothetical protein
VVHDKKRSGDPDYDDKVPMRQHAGGEVTEDADGNEAIVTEAAGPVGADGSHAVLSDQDVDGGDNRPAPGGVATEESTVQKYDGSDVETAAKGDTAKDNAAKGRRTS